MHTNTTYVEVAEIEEAEILSAEYEAWLEEIDAAREAQAARECGE